MSLQWAIRQYGPLISGMEGQYISGTISISGQSVVISNTGFQVSGAVQVSGTVTISNTGFVVSGVGQTNSGLNVWTVSGDTIMVLSGGTIPVAVISGAMNISGGVTVSGGIAVSGTVGVSGNVAILSGSLSVSSGIVYVMSGLVNILSGERALDLSGASLVQLIVGASGSHVLQAGLYWQYTEIHAGAITNVQSGASVLHAIVVNSWVSGEQIVVKDCLSGNAGATVATIGPIPASGNVLPQSVIYDAFMKSGIVIVTSGAGSVTVTFRNPV